MPADAIDHIREQWGQERPDLDTSGLALAGRILVLGKLLGRRVEAALAPLDLSLWAFDVLATLRRHGAERRMTPTELTRATMLTSGAMTNRLDRLEQAGLLRREPDPSDRRGTLVSLTAEGLALVERAAEARFAEAEELASRLTPNQRGTLEGLLRRLLVSLEKEPG